MKMEREEAFDLFRKWQAEGALLLCNLGFPLFAAAFRGRITKFSPLELCLMSDDTRSEFAMTFKPDMEFFYEDSRRVPSEAELYECGISIMFQQDALQTAEQRDHIGFTQVK